MQNPKILLVEDDHNLGDILKEYLTLKGYDAKLYKDGAAGLQAFQQYPFDICILDIMMPIMDGFTLAQKIRDANQSIPIIFLSAKSMKEDKLRGFKIGADDYMTKPFSMEELQYRINAILRRAQSTPQQASPIAQQVTPQMEIYTIGQYEFNYVKQILSKGIQELKLTTKESALLRLLCQHKNGVLSREHALKSIWGDDNYFTARSMDVFITKLRKYLKGDDNVRIINVHSKGYKLVDC